ncbi:hypothetical protein JL101_035660 (plasmid) [Skermanella rosea]|uniref:hypothetical protein n=1 Tax=Skermanella rosea TaxID=1817965 RepID=UPI0019311FDD|nr:hypothetical protein [Skermanella rosea]UEM08136.1 hypothetical protein JL101_035660 [Skermanella rosea]
MTNLRRAKTGEHGNIRKPHSLDFHLNPNGEIKASATGVIGICGLVLLVLAVTALLAA